MYLQLGDMRKYCDILVELGQWDKAVSVAYWRTLCRQYADHLATVENGDPVRNAGLRIVHVRVRCSNRGVVGTRYPTLSPATTRRHW
jgi:hypothetical protein